jgi:hypothetical protein
MLCLTNSTVVIGLKMAGAPLGNTNGAKRKRLLGDALKRELTQKPEDILKIAQTLIEKAKSGEAWAQALILERVDGKMPQALVGDDDEPAIQIGEIVVRGIRAGIT